MNHTEEKITMDYATILASSIHDMKNSLSMLLNSLETMIEEQDNDDHSETQQDFSQMRYEGQRVNNNLLQLLALYRVNNKQYMVHIDNHIIIDFLEDALLPHQSMLDHNQISIKLNCDLDLEWFFDQDMVAGVLTNVFNNLYRYTKDKVSVEAFIESEYLVLRVKDNGPGYPTELQYSERDKFRGIDFTSGSSGLGLYFARVVGEIHINKGKTGYIITNNEGINGGGCFSLYLP